MRVHLIAAALAAVLLPRPALADSPESRAAAYLQAHQSAEGSITSGPSENAILSTAEAVRALRALGGHDDAVQRAQAFLANAQPNTSHEQIERLIALTGSTSQDLTDASSLMLLLSPSATDGLGVPFAQGFAAGEGAPNVLETALALQALAPPGADPGVAFSLRPAADVLLSLEGPNGWYLADNAPDVATSALAVESLSPLRFLPEVPGLLNLELNRLLGQQQSSGAITDGADPAGDTAHALLALSGIGSGNLTLTTQPAAASSFLTGTQGSDGSWGSQAYRTALVLRALAGQRPNYRALPDESGRAQVDLSTISALSGETVTASLSVVNTSTVAAPVTTVRFLARPATGGNAVVLGEAPLSALAPQDIRSASLSFSTAGMSGSYLITASADPDDQVGELIETDNAATSTLTVVQATDLAINATDITFQQLSASQLQISARVHNVGDAVSTPFVVAFSKGNPSTTGVTLGTAPISSMASNSTQTVTLTVDATALNGPTPFYVTVDSGHAVTEANETNNQAFRYYTPGSAASVDLAILSYEIATVPAAVLVNQPTDLVVRVRNNASVDAVHVGVRATHEVDGVVANQEIDVVPAQGSVLLHLPVVFHNSGSMEVTADPDRLLNDSYRGNNTGNIGINLAEAPIDLSVGLDFDNSTQELVGYARNLGLSPANANLTFYLGDPRAGQATTLSSALVKLGAQMGGPNDFVQVRYRPGAIADNTLFAACIEPAAGTGADSNLNDNCATYTRSSGSTDLYLSSKSITVNPVGPDLGEAVTVTVPVGNRGSVPSQAEVLLWQGPAHGADSRLLGQQHAQVPAGGTIPLAFSFFRQPGPLTLEATVEDVVPRETNGYDNRAIHHLFLKSVVDDGWINSGGEGMVVVGDLFGAGQPSVVIQEGGQGQARLQVVQLQPNGSTVKTWDRELLAGDGSGSMNLLPPVLGDLEGDGHGEIVAEVVQNGPGGPDRLHVLNADGSEKWSRDVAPDHPCHWVNYPNRGPVLGDVDGDGVADVVIADDSLRVFSGVDGHPLWATPFYPGSNFCLNGAQIVVADLDDDGHNEVVVSLGSAILATYGYDGTFRWSAPPGQFDTFALVDLDGDGSPELVQSMFRNSTVRVLDAVTGLPKFNGQTPDLDLSSGTIAVGSVRQDGLPYVVVANNDFSVKLAVLHPEGTELWSGADDPYGGNPYQITLADLLGQGRPQAILQNQFRDFSLVDTRTAERLIPSSVGIQKLIYGNPVVADVDGDGIGDAMVPYGYWSGNDYPGVNFLVFSSVHWKRMPKVWDQTVYVQGHVDEQLKVSSHFQPWKTHNTWGQQFYDTPSTPMPDLAVAQADVIAATATPAAGDATSVTVTVHNLGGLPVGSAVVDLYDGDPDAGAPLIGSATANGPIASMAIQHEPDGGFVSQGGSASVSIPWTPYPEGEHHLYAVVNADKIPEESGYENNQATIRLLVNPGTNLSDVALTMVSASPAAPLAGTTATLTATVTNLGVRGSGAFNVAFYDGVPAADGSNLLGSTAVADLASGASTTATFTFLPLPGGHDLYAVADPEGHTLDADRGNNTAFTTLTAPAENSPDLAILGRDFVASPSPVAAGQAATLSATVRNLGTTVQQTSVAFYEGDPTGGTLLGVVPLVGQLPPGGTAVATLPLSTVGRSGSYTFTAVVDPDGVNADSNLGNNSAQTTLTVTSPRVALSAATDQGTYLANSPVTASVVLQNQASTSRTFSVDVWVENGAGAQVASLTSGQSALLAGGHSQTLSLSWNTGATLPGAYRLRARVSESGAALAYALSPFSIQASPQLYARLTADRVSYLPGEPALLSQYLRNDSVNASTGDLTTVVTVHDGATELFRKVRALSSLGRGNTLSATDQFSVSASLPPGTYAATLEVYDSGSGLLAASQTPLTVGAPSASQALTASVTSNPAQFVPGGAETFTVSLVNHGNVPVSSAVHVLVFPVSQLTPEADLSTQVSVPVGGSQAASLTWTSPANEPLGDKLVVVQVNGTTLARTLITATTTPPDTLPPTVVVSGVADQQYTRSAVTPVISVTDQSAVTASYQLDGQPFMSGTTVSAEGSHLLVIDAVDAYANSTHLEIRFTIDTTDPVVTVAGATEGEVTRDASRTITFGATDNLSATADLVLAATLNGQPFTSGSVVSDEGDYTLIVTATDRAGNAGTQTVHFALDRTAPSLSVGGVSNGQITNAAQLTISYSQTEAHPGSLTATLYSTSGSGPFQSGDSVSAEDDYQLVVEATDQAGNTSSQTVTFAIDRTAPNLTLAGVSEGQLSASPLTPTFGATDLHGATVVATLTTASGSAPFTSGTTLSADGDYTLAVTATDPASNSASQTVHFAIDTLPPQITLGGFVEGALLASAVTPTYSATDPHLASVSATLNGNPFTSGTQVTVDGDYTLAVTATDTLGHSASATGTFHIDRTGPAITITGVTEGQHTAQNVSITYSATDLHGPVTVSATLDGNSFASGSTVSSEGAHTLVVTASDALGNSSTQTVHFTIDRSAPVISVSGVTDGQVTASNLTITYSATDTDLDSVSATLNGNAFSSGTTVTAEADYTLVVTATDLTGNTSTQTVHFAIDRTNPAPTISGVTEGQVAQSVTPAASPGDLHPATTTATLDGQAFTLGGSITAEGSHTLVVTVTDKAGNVGTATVHFIIDRTAPTITLSGIANGQYANAPVTITFGQTDAHAGTTTATLNGSPFGSGSTVSAEGAYTLVVTATDQAGNSTTQTLHFTIDLTAPVVTVTGVADGALYGHAVTPAASATDNASTSANLTLSATLNGNPFTLGSSVSGTGTYTLVVTATDQAGNHGQRTVSFELDQTPPQIAISGVSEGQYTSGSVTPVITVTEAHPGTQSLTLDGVAFTSGTTVSAEGNHTLAVTATDALGNAASPVSVHFTLDHTAPVITLSGVQNGSTYTAAAPVPVFSATDNLTASNQITLSATLDGQAFPSGTAVTQNGTHTLIVTATDRAGNSTSQSVQFVVQVAGFTITSGQTATGRALVAFECSQNQVSQGTCPGVTTELQAALSAAHLAYDLAPTETDFLTLMRENRYALYVLDQPGKLGSSLASELAEHLFEGTGLLVLRNNNAEDPNLRPLVGVQVQGKLKGIGSVSITNTAIAPTGALTTAGDMAELSPLDASVQTVATGVASGNRTVKVGTAWSYGQGKVVYLAWNPEAAPSNRMTQVLSGALAYVGSGPALSEVPLAVADLVTQVTNRAGTAQDIQVEAIPPTGSTVLFELPALYAPSPPTFRATVQPSATATFELGVRLPDAAGTELFSLEVDQKQGSSYVPYSTPSVTYSVLRSSSQLRSDAESALSALSVTGADATHRNSALADLAALVDATTTAQAEANIGRVLSALAETEAISSTDVTAARLKLDALLRYQENLSSSLRSWP